MITTDDLVKVTNFETLVKVLRDQLDWPIPEDYEFGDVTYEYEAKELGLKPDQIAKIREVHQLRPLTTNQPWGIFFVSFEDKGIPVTVMRRILRSLVLTKRADAKDANRAAWQRNDLLFISAHGKGGARELSFAHFADGKETGDLPVLRVLNWNRDDTVSHNQYVTEMLNKRLHWPDDPNNLAAWRAAWASAFEIGYQETIRTAKDMSVSLAALARQIRKRANELLSAEAESGSMRQLLKAFRENLIKDLSEDDFADMFAQTISYGLLAARMSRPAGLVVDNLADMIPPTNPFLKELFATFLKLGGRDRRKDMDFDELGVRDVVDMLNRANMESVLRDFGDRNPKEDPVIHFYELFLKEYDAQKRMQRGVFYTPRPVVSFIVRGVDEVLRTEFGLPLGLADTTTWGEIAARNPNISVPEHVDPDQPFVQILDPATGTGTFLVEVIDLIHQRMLSTWKAAGKKRAEVDALWQAYVPMSLLPRITAFELMMAPYAIAHMKVGLKLFETGYRFEDDARARIFLTNALEPFRDLDMEFMFMSEALAHEASAANDAKSRTPFTVVVGNPPYSKSITKTAWISDLVKCFRDGLDERKSDTQREEWKFLRLASYHLAKNGMGVLGVISNNSFLTAPTLRLLRKHILELFERGFVVNLHGDSNMQEVTPEGERDENVFEIKQGVAISVFSRVPGDQTQRRGVRYADVWGTRTEKIDLLGAGDVKPKHLLAPTAASAFLLTPESAETDAVYADAIQLPRLLPIVCGIETKRDHFALAFTPEELKARVQQFVDFNGSEAALKERFEVRDNDWSVAGAKSSLTDDPSWARYIERCSVRPFDERAVFYCDFVLARTRGPSMAAMSSGNLGLVVPRQTKEDFGVFVADEIITHKYVTGYDRSFIAPLFGPRAKDGRQDALLKRDAVREFEGQINLAYLESSSTDKATMRLPTGRGDLTSNFGPRDLFDWTYAVLHSPAYRVRYEKFLKSDFPRIPRPRTRALFVALTKLGSELVNLHLLKIDNVPSLKSPDVRFRGTGESLVARGYPKFENGKVLINQSRWFEDVPRETWDFKIGGYQVLEKWLKDRAATGGQRPSAGRVLTEEDILHYRRMVVALTETRRLMAEIDRVIDQHGGWASAFASATSGAS